MMSAQEQLLALINEIIIEWELTMRPHANGLEEVEHRRQVWEYRTRIKVLAEAARNAGYVAGRLDERGTPI